MIQRASKGTKEGGRKASGNRRNQRIGGRKNLE